MKALVKLSENLAVHGSRPPLEILKFASKLAGLSVLFHKLRGLVVFGSISEESFSAMAAGAVESSLTFAGYTLNRLLASCDSNL